MIPRSLQLKLNNNFINLKVGYKRDTYLGNTLNYLHLESI